MEELKKSMKTMYKNTTNEDDADKFLHFCPRYRPPVKIANWYLPLEAYPKDNDPYNPPGGHYFLSTYKRLGTASEDDHWETTTKAMLSQVCEVEGADATVYKPMVNFTTGRLLEDDEKYHEGLEAEEIDSVTTYNNDFRHPFPFKRYSPKIEVDLVLRQATKYFVDIQYLGGKALLGDSTNVKFGIKKTQFNLAALEICDTKFMDDDLLRVGCSPSKS